MTGGGSYCAGGTGVHVGLAASQSGIRYDLWNGSSFRGSVTGTGGAIDFGLQTMAGTYVVTANNTTTLCTANMLGTAIITINTLPAVYTLSGGGNYCSGGNGADITLDNSQSGVTYQLYNGTLPTGTPMGGTGSALDFGLRTGAGSYTIVGTNSTTGCASAMGSAVSIGILPAPAAYSITGGGGYCAGGTGAAIGLAGSQAGVSYRLYNGGTLAATVSGTGAAIDFGMQAATGTYTVMATNTTSGCTAAMSGSTIVSVNTLPAAHIVTGGGSYCSGGTGVHVGPEQLFGRYPLPVV